MRSGLDAHKLQAFIEEIGKRSQGPGRIYLVGGATALLLGIRAQTVDIDIKLEPEPKGIFEAIATIKELLDLNVELASPDHFIPALPGWRDRSEFIVKSGPVDFFHYDFYGQALSKILRGHRTDLSDADALVTLGKVIPSKLLELFEEIRPELIRYPAISQTKFESNLNQFIENLQ